jgi:uncharacterized membrane protein
MRTLHTRAQDSMLVRPLLFIVAGLVLAQVSLAIDLALGPDAAPTWLQFPAGTARALLITLAGATLTVAGITFWVRAASVQLAAAQYSPRVVHGFLQDWFQQSMMGLLVGFFAFIVSVLRVMPDVGASVGIDVEAVPDFSVLACVLLAGGSVLVVLVAIRNSVRSMQPGELARRITDQTVEQIQSTHRPAGVDAEAGDLALDRPLGGGLIVRATGHGWVQDLDVRGLLGALPEGAIVRLDVRVGLFVVRGRQLCTIWGAGELDDRVIEHLRDSIRLGRSRTMAQDIHYGIQQLVDVAHGSLSQGTADAGSAYEVIAHIEMVLRELLLRELPATETVDALDRRLLRPREYTFFDYVGEAFDRLRLAAAPHPTVVIALLESVGTLVTDLRAAGHQRRVAPLLRQAGLIIAAAEAAGHLEEDLVVIRRVAARARLVRSQARVD